MLVFIDESGDPGFSVEQGSSLVFVAAMVIFASGEDARITQATVEALQARLKIHPELKFNKMKHAARDAFFEGVQACPFSVRAIVIRKEVIRSVHLKSDKEDFYRFFVRQMMSHDGRTLRGADVVIDGSGDRAFKNELRSYLRRELGDRVRRVRLKNSRNDLLVQLADMCAGAIARSYRHDRKHASRWRDMLWMRTEDVWEFE